MSNKLILAGSKEFRRQLWLGFNASSTTILVSLYGQKAKDQTLTGQMLAFVGGKISDCRLDHAHPGLNPCLWIGHTAFDVSHAEAERIRETFVPLGLRVVEAAPAVSCQS